MDKRYIDGIEVSHLGMGMMRLPVNEKDEIDRVKAMKLIDKLMEGGVTYYDTAWFYHRHMSEKFTGDALTARYPRESFKLATKIPLGRVNEFSDAVTLFETQLKNLQTDMIDFYLLHGIDGKGFDKAVELGILDYLSKKQDEGIIGKLGFSFHGTTADFPRILDSYNFKFAQILFNYYDYYKGDTKSLYDDAVKRNIPLISMEPVRGGSLVKMYDGALKRIAPIGTPASAALRWVGSLPGTAVVLSGMSDIEQAEENISIFSDFKPLNDTENSMVKEAVNTLSELPLIPCSKCKYCDQCPKGIPIHELFGGYNDLIQFNGTWTIPRRYFNEIDEDKRASACIECGLCNKACPQGIDVIKNLKIVHDKAIECQSTVSS